MTGSAQDRPSPRRLVSTSSAPAIDRGFRANDPPRQRRRALRRARNAFLGGSIIVKFRPGTTETAQRLMLAQVDGTRSTRSSYADFDVVSIGPDEDAEAVARRLGAQPDVEYAQARYVVSPQLVPNDPLYSQQWNYPALDMERAWDINPGASPSIVVAVLDTGVAYRSASFEFEMLSPFQLEEDGPVLPALGTVMVPFAAAPDLGGEERFVAPRDFIWGDNTPLDTDGHGTHVTGTIGQLTNNTLGVAGMAFNVRIMPIKVVATTWDDIFESPFIGTDDIVARGIRYAADNGAKVLNLSLGRTGGPAPVINDAIEYAVARGAFVVVAGGNDFLVGNPIQRPSDAGPRIDGLVTVAATGREGFRADYSSTGTYIELAAPGGTIVQGGRRGLILQQTYDLDLVETFFRSPAQFGPPRFDAFSYEYFEGTSMAAAHVSGFAAMLMQQGITNPAAIEAVMKQYATDLGPRGRDNEYGYGLINPRATLRGMGLVR